MMLTSKSLIAFVVTILIVILSSVSYAQNSEAKEPVSETAAQQQQQPPKDPLRWQNGRYTLKLGIEGAGQITPQANLWWNLPRTFAPTSGFDADRAWFEMYFRPSLKADIRISRKTSIYGGISMVAATNVGLDVFDQGNTGRVLLEDAYVGVKHKEDNGFELDLSGGSQPFRIASGFLIANGAANGFERGATTLNPRRAWQMTGIGRFAYKKFSATAFYLDPNELKSSDSKTRLAGVKFEFAPGPDEYLGFSYITSPTSGYAYIQAPITFITDAREGLKTAYGYGKLRPAKKSAPGLVIAGDYAKQWNDRIDLDAWAMNLEVNNTFVKRKWLPTLGYAFRYYSGDDPSTPELERFDSLYYDGGPSTFAAGSNGSFAFYNSNIVVHRAKFGLVFDQQNLFDAYYYHVRAAQTNSPIQFGQGFRFVFVSGVPSLITGVPEPHLSDDVYLQYTRVLTKNIFLTTGLAISVPGKGLKSISNNTTDTWTGGLANLVFAF